MSRVTAVLKALPGSSFEECLLSGRKVRLLGYRMDDTVMRVAEVFMASPWIYLLFAVRGFLRLYGGPRESFLLPVGVIGPTGWARPSRLIRWVILRPKEGDFACAARGLSASSDYILLSHLLPETTAVVLIQAAILIPHRSLTEVTLSFLGLGVGGPVPSWGNMPASPQKYSGRRQDLISRS